jgi:hypothetical protein
MKKAMLASAILSVVFGAGCTWVKPTLGGERVVVVTPEQANYCEKLGQTRQTGVSKVGFLDRSSEKVAEELATLARNSAADMGGNAIIPLTQPVGGKQTFAVLRCPNL